jgi:hypothetical protein
LFPVPSGTMPETERELIGVYDADGTLVGEVRYRIGAQCVAMMASCASAAASARIRNTVTRGLA